MSKNIVEELPARKHASPDVVKKKGDSVDSKKGGSSVKEASAKRVRQAVYDIRYRARRENIDLKAAYAQYMSNSNLSQAERTAVKEKLFGKGGVKEAYTVGYEDWAFEGVNDALYKVFVENEKEDTELSYVEQLSEDDGNRKYKVRVKDKNGRAYVRLADRKKITQLRGNPSIDSVEMTDHGDPYEGSRKKSGKLDPVGKEDSDVDNDGDSDNSDKYLLKRRAAIGKSIRDRASKKIEEAIKVDNYNKAEGKKVVVGPDDGAPEKKTSKLYAHREVDGQIIAEELPVPKHVAKLKERQQQAASAPAGEPAEDPRLQRVNRNIEYIKAKLELNKVKGFEQAAEKESAERQQASTPQPSPTSQSKPKVSKEPTDGSKLNLESTVNTANCEKKPEDKEKDMRGTYAKLNLVKNKLRAMGAKNPIVMLDDIDDETEKKKVDEGLGSTIQGGLEKTFDKVDELSKTPIGKPVTKVLKTIFGPNKGNKGKDYPTQAENQRRIEQNKY